MPRYSDLLPYQPLPGRGGRLSDLSRQELNAYVDQVAPDAALRFGNMARADYPYSMDGQGMRQALEDELQRMDKGMQGQTLDQAAVATSGVPILGDAVGLAADAKAVYDDPSWMNIGGAALGALPFVPFGGMFRQISTASSLDDIERAAKDVGVDLSLSGRGNQITVNKIVVPENMRGKGIGSDVMRSINEYADANQKTLALTPSADFGGNKARLQKFYSGLGFEPNKGRSRDFEISETMRRYPTRQPQQQPTGIRAYHGSPHDFDKFDLSKIGTGEGAQAYGHGLYFAEAEDVARSYRDTLAGRAARFEGRLSPKGEFAADFISNGASDIQIMENMIKKYDGISFDEVMAAIEEAKAAGVRPGRMYEVNINADPEDFVNFDGRLQEQPEAVKRWLEQNLGYTVTPDMDGGRSMNMALQSVDNKAGRLQRSGFSPELSADLREAGIPGIRYLDQGSRAAGEGSRNYVVFDDALIDIIRKYGIGALLGGSGAFGLMSMQGDDGTQPPL